MRLEYAPKTLRTVVIPDRPQRRLDLRGMVGVVVQHDDIARPALQGHPAMGALVAAEPIGDLLGLQPRVVQQSRGRQGVVDLVQARQLEGYVAEVPAVTGDVEGVRAPPAVELGGHPSAAGGQPERLDLTRRLADGLGGLAVVAVDHQHPVGGHLGGEGAEGLDDRIQVAEAVEVVVVDIQDGRQRGLEVQEGPVVLARLGHEVRAIAHAAGPAQLGDGRPDHVRRALAGGDQRVRHHARGRALAVGARHRHAAALAHQPAEHLAVLDHLAPALAGGKEFGVGFVDGGGVHHQVGHLGQILPLLADVDDCAAAGEAVQGGRGRAIGAADRRAASHQQLGQRPHSAAADADQMDRLADVRNAGAAHLDGLTFLPDHRFAHGMASGDTSQTPPQIGKGNSSIPIARGAGFALEALVRPTTGRSRGRRRSGPCPRPRRSSPPGEARRP